MTLTVWLRSSRQSSAVYQSLPKSTEVYQKKAAAKLAMKKSVSYDLASYQSVQNNQVMCRPCMYNNAFTYAITVQQKVGFLETYGDLQQTAAGALAYQLLAYT